MAAKDKGQRPRKRSTGGPASARPRTAARTAAPKPSAETRAVAAAATARRSKRTMPVHALADERVHLALAQPGRLRQGYLKTLCGLQVVSALSPFALADTSQKRCRTCLGKVDGDGMTTV